MRGKAVVFSPTFNCTAIGSRIGAQKRNNNGATEYAPQVEAY